MSLRADAIACGVCPDCFNPSQGLADVCCPACHERRRRHLAELEKRGCGGQSCTDEMEAKMSHSGGCDNEETRKKRSGAKNGMVIRKGEIYGG